MNGRGDSPAIFYGHRFHFSWFAGFSALTWNKVEGANRKVGGAQLGGRSREVITYEALHHIGSKFCLISKCQLQRLTLCFKCFIPAAPLSPPLQRTWPCSPEVTNFRTPKSSRWKNHPGLLIFPTTGQRRGTKTLVTRLRSTWIRLATRCLFLKSGKKYCKELLESLSLDRHKQL